MATTKQLELRFRNEKGQLKKMTLTHAREDVSSDQAKQALEAIQQAGGFLDDKGLNPYAKVAGAAYVTRTVDTLYAVTEEEEA